MTRPGTEEIMLAAPVSPDGCVALGSFLASLKAGGECALAGLNVPEELQNLLKVNLTKLPELFIFLIFNCRVDKYYSCLGRGWDLILTS